MRRILAAIRSSAVPFGPIVLTGTFPSGETGDAYTFTPGVSGGMGTIVLTYSGLPPGVVVLDAATGELGGTLSGGGTYQVTLTATDAAGQRARLRGTVIVVAPPLALSGTLAAATEGEAYSSGLTASGGVEPYAWDISVGTLPDGLSINSGTGVISGTPSDGEAGSYPITIRVTDSSDPPQQTTSEQTLEVGSAFAGTVVFQDGFETVSTTSFTADTGQTVTLTSADSGDATAKYGSGSLDTGTSGYATVPDSSDWDFGGDDFTIQLWYRSSDGYYSFNRGLIVADAIGGTRGWALRFVVDGISNNLGFVTYSGGTPTLLSTTFVPTANTWHHIAIVRDGGTLRMYKDGVQIATQAIAANVTGTNQPLVIGCLWGTGSPVANSYARGRFDDVQIIKGHCLYPDGTTFTPPGELPPP